MNAGEPVSEKLYRCGWCENLAQWPPRVKLTGFVPTNAAGILLPMRRRYFCSVEHFWAWVARWRPE